MKLFKGRILRRFTEDPTPSSRAYYGRATATEVVTNPGDADVVSSDLPGTKRHLPVIDLDVPCTLVPSATPGHSHLYIDVSMTWAKFEAILVALVDAGVVERGYLEASRKRGHTSVRVPWKPKA